MASVYTKGTRVWLPDKEAGWVPGTVTSVAIPGAPNPDSEVIIAVLIDGRAADEGGFKEFKCSFATLQSASESNGNNLSLGSSQDVLPPLRNPPLLESSEDLASLSNLNEPSGECSIGPPHKSQLTSSSPRDCDTICDAPALHLLRHCIGMLPTTEDQSELTFRLH